MRLPFHPLPKRLATSILVAIALVSGALAYFTTTGSGNASGSVTSLGAPASPAATASGTTATITWNASTIGGTVAATSYTVERYSSAGADLGAAGCSPVPSSSGTPNAFGSFTCSDSPGGGSFKYKITAKYHTSWTATTAFTSTVSVQSSTSTSASGPATDATNAAIATGSISSTLSGAGAGATGTITFKVFGPQASAPSTCTSGGTTVGTATVSGNATYHPSASYTPSSAGTYWWYASYGGDSGNTASASTCGSGMSSTVVTNAGALTASAPASGSAGSALAASSISSALSGATAGATGTITFTVFGPQTTAPATCTSGGTTVGTATVSGNATYNPSAGYTPATVGTYWWYASYSGDSSNSAATSTCGSGMASTVVGKATAPLTAGAPATDTPGTAIGTGSITAALSGATSGATGTITFTVFGPQASAPTTCTSGGTTVGTATVSGNGTYNPSAGYTPATTGTYWWYASYGGDSNNNSSASTCGSGMTSTAVMNTTATLASAPATGISTSAITASSISSTLSGATSGATGTITFKVFGPQTTAPSSCTSGGTTVGTATVSGNATYHPSAGFTPSSAGVYWWYASYGGDANNSASSSLCGSPIASTYVYSVSSAASGIVTTGTSVPTGSFTLQPSTTYLLLVFRHSSANDSISSISSSGLSPALTLGSFTSITSQTYNTSDYQWAYYLTTSSSASGTGTLTVNFANALSGTETSMVSLLALGGNSSSNPIVTGNEALTSGSGTAATANLTYPPGSVDSSLVFLSANKGLGGSAPAASPTMTNAIYSQNSAGTLDAYTVTPGSQNESFTITSAPWGTIALEIRRAGSVNSPTMTVGAPSTGTAGATITAGNLSATLSGASSAATNAITYTVFGPQASAPTTCTTGGTAVGAAVTVSGNGPYNPSAGFTPTQAGTYWWYADYSGDANDSHTPSTCGAGMTSTVVSGASTTLSASGPGTGEAGSAISASSITSSLSGGSSPTGTITYTVFGPQATAPATCTSGGTTVGTSAVSGNGMYTSSASFTPLAAGMYWWYASYGGDGNNGSTTSTCGSGMPSTNAAWSLSPTSGTNTTSGSSVALTSTNLTSLQSIDSNVFTTSNWVTTDPFAATNIHGLAWPSASTAYAFGFSGTLLKSTNGGVDWTAQTSGTTNNLTDGACLSTTSCWAVGNSGTILHTTDGSTWAAQTSSTTNNFNGVWAVETSHVWAVGNSGTIDFYNGTAWATQTSGTANNLNGVYCVDSSHCWAAGNSGTIDFYNGTTWATQTSGTTQTLNGVYCLDSTHCWAVGNSGTILFYNGTSWATQTSGTTNALQGVTFVDSSHGWASGASGTVLFYNGTSWSAQTADATANNCFAVAFFDANHGLLGCDTKNSPAIDLQRTGDGGSDWVSLGSQYLQFGFSPALSPSATIVSVKATFTYKTSAAPGSASIFWVLASPDGGTTWTYYALPAGSTTAATATVDLSSLITTLTQLQNLALRFYVSQGSTFTTSHDYVNLQVAQTW